jgi:hypothetical protein
VLVKPAIEDEKTVAKESTTILKNPTSAKKKKCIVLVEDTLSTKKCLGLSDKMTK